MSKSCDNCGKFDDCRNSTAKWPCHGYSAWEPKNEADTLTEERDTLKARVEEL